MLRILTLAGLCLAAARPAHAQSTDDEAVRAVVDSLFIGMRLADTAMVRSVFHADARLVSTGSRNGSPAVSIAPVDGFVTAVGGASEVWDERLYDIEVRIDGNLAAVWTQYTFHAGDQFSHCGVDAIQLVRTDAGWKIIQIADTRRQDGCEKLLERPSGVGR